MKNAHAILAIVSSLAAIDAAEETASFLKCLADSRGLAFNSGEIKSGEELSGAYAEVGRYKFALHANNPAHGEPSRIVYFLDAVEVDEVGFLTALRDDMAIEVQKARAEKAALAKEQEELEIKAAGMVRQIAGLN